MNDFAVIGSTSFVVGFYREYDGIDLREGGGICRYALELNRDARMYVASVAHGGCAGLARTEKGGYVGVRVRCCQPSSCVRYSTRRTYKYTCG